MNTQWLSGKWKELKGATLENLGKLFHDEALRERGEAEKVHGRIQSAANADEAKDHAFVKRIRPEIAENGFILSNLKSEAGKIGYIIAWLLGVPASLLFIIFLIRGH